MAQPTLVFAPTETPAIRCKTCKVPLPDATRKNCERCRRIRTDNYNRWKRSAEARKNHGKNLISLPTPETHPSSAPPSNVNIRWMKPATASASSSQPSRRSHPGLGIPWRLTVDVTNTSSTSLDSNLNERNHHRHQTASSKISIDSPLLMSSLPSGIHIPEYQWGEELVNTLLALPPRSNFFGQFSVIADPDVDNSKRAQMFRDQLRSRGLPTSYVAASSFGFSFVEPYSHHLFSSHLPREAQTPVSGSPNAPNGHAIGLYCRCEVGCQGRFIVSVDNDTTHPHSIPGQRIGVALLHTSK